MPDINQLSDKIFAAAQAIAPTILSTLLPPNDPGLGMRENVFPIAAAISGALTGDNWALNQFTNYYRPVLDQAVEQFKQAINQLPANFSSGDMVNYYNQNYAPKQYRTYTMGRGEMVGQTLKTPVGSRWDNAVQQAYAQDPTILKFSPQIVSAEGAPILPAGSKARQEAPPAVYQNIPGQTVQTAPQQSLFNNMIDPNSVRFLSSMNQAQRDGIMKLVQSKPLNQWTDTDARNYQTATGINIGSVINMVKSKPLEQWNATDMANYRTATGVDLRGQQYNAVVSGRMIGQISGRMAGQAEQVSVGQMGGLSSGVDTSNWTPAMQQSYDAIKQYADKLLAQNKVLNPNVTIDDTIINKFMDQAKTELGPYYNQLFSQSQADVKKELDRLSQDYASRERQLELEYGKQLESTQESYARRGLAFGSERQKAEQELAGQAKTALEATQQAATRQAEDIGTKGERMLGSSMFPAGTAGITAGTRPITGIPGDYGFDIGKQTRQLFTPLGGVTGELGRSQMFDVEARKKQLLGSEREFRSEFYM